jgi:hypothetical protein
LQEYQSFFFLKKNDPSYSPFDADWRDNPCTNSSPTLQEYQSFFFMKKIICPLFLLMLMG